MKMRVIHTLVLAAAISAATSHANAAQLSVGNIDVFPGQNLELSINLIDAALLSGIQFDVAYPVGVLASQGAVAGGDLPAGCLVDSEIVSNDGVTETRRILIHSSGNITFGNGHIVGLPITIGNDAPIGSESIVLSGVVAGNSNASSADVSGGSATIAVDVATTYQITSGVFGANGAIDPAGTTVVQEGSSQVFVLSPSNGYAVDQIVIDGRSVPPAGQYSFESVSVNHTIFVSFKFAPSASLELLYTPSNGGADVAELNFTGTPGTVFKVEHSLGLINWSEIGTVTLEGGVATFDLAPYLDSGDTHFFRGKAQ
jgi:hypothetical protein